ncbi:glycoside hydrolase family 2 protein [Cohnella nanjingensis]|uniref:Beta-galactosidase n=1 Tax=Cohnella nanjingensis TaxID=1387779 RepID=A0A7X0RNQ7_9BACL|nr:glycoside hydrolase family 2 TIM barrel-domain containing protein [Cohnella nanjingensis]MBB6670805.1 hypothetical protein [Cohnella nanjingensis]
MTKNGSQVLDAAWLIARDVENRGRDEAWFAEAKRDIAEQAEVPAILQMTFSDYHGVVWYWNDFVPEVDHGPGLRYRLAFEFIDYYSEIWLNGCRLGSHEGGELPFDFDVTDMLKPDGQNLLAVRLLNPTADPIDGIALKETPHRNKVPRGIFPGNGFNYGGIIAPVVLFAEPAVRIKNIFVRPDVKTGEIKIEATVHNAAAAGAAGKLTVRVGPKQTGMIQAEEERQAVFAAGDSEHAINVTIQNPQLWSLETPSLYRVDVILETLGESALRHERIVQCGFRDFRVERGYFQLNGKRIFVRSTHTGNHYAAGAVVPVDPNWLRQDLIYAKALGFNMVRFISGVAFQEQLDFCDEIGLLVYEECMAAWCLGESPRMEALFDDSTLGMIRRDRNHPSVVIWGLLNETGDGRLYRHAASLLPKVRAVDDTRLVLLSSGRWDRQLDTGSLSNPGTTEWQYEWGFEAPDMEPMEELPSHPWSRGYPVGLFERMGDIHIYPVEPRTENIDRLIRTIGADSKPVFLSEFGIGSILNVIRIVRHFERMGANPDWEDLALFRSIAERLEADWERYGMDGVYPFPEDMLIDSERLHSVQRSHAFDLVRSNARYCGYNLTGMLDHGYTAEGLWTLFREWKPGIAETLQNGWAPLRWCLFVRPKHAYAGRAFTVEAVLANEDALPPGEYPVCLRITGPRGKVWEHRLSVRIPEPDEHGDGPLAVPVFEGQVTLREETGTYLFTAYMEQGGAPAGGRLSFHLTEPADASHGSSVRIATLGLDAAAEQWLTDRNAEWYAYDRSGPNDCRVILAGDLSESGMTDSDWQTLYGYADQGATIVFLSPAAFRLGEDSMGRFPFANKGRSYVFNDWLYHKECVAKRHPWFAGLQQQGVIDWDYYGQVIPRIVFEGQDTPDEVMAAYFATGYPVDGGYAGGILLGAYRYGAGRIVVNTFRILENLDRHPAADRLLMNMIGDKHRETSRNRQGGC